MEQPHSAKNPIKSTKVTLDVIQALKDLDGARISELADHLDRSKSSVHNYLSTLREEGYVVKEGQSYYVGLRFLDFGAYARHRRQIYEVARPHVKQLAEETGELANLLVEEHGRGVYLYRERGDQAVKVDSYTGHRVYLHNTALGKAILAAMSDDQVEEIIDRHGLPSTTENTVSDRDELFQELETIRGRDVAFDREERLEGLCCVAAAVTDSSDRPRGAISVSGPASRMQGEWYEKELPEELRNMVNIIGLNLTYS